VHSNFLRVVLHLHQSLQHWIFFCTKIRVYTLKILNTEGQDKIWEQSSNLLKAEMLTLKQAELLTLKQDVMLTPKQADIISSLYKVLQEFDNQHRESHLYNKAERNTLKIIVKRSKNGITFKVPILNSQHTYLHYISLCSFTMRTPPPIHSKASSTNTSSTNTSNANNNAAPARPTMNTDYTKTVNVNKVPFDGTGASFYLWTTQIWFLLRHTMLYKHF
jgi:hypothetical protein